MKTLLDLATQLSLSDNKTLSQKALKLSEECGELAKAVLPYEGAGCCHHRFPNRDKIVEECADVMLVAYSIAKSLGVSDNEITEMAMRKALYWQTLQEGEAETDLNNLMFEVHITVEATHDIDAFRADCAEIGVKPIILDLYTSGEPILDVMTSSHMKGTTTQAAIYSRGLVSELQSRGYRVVREKIETVPWHPASQQAHLNPDASRYFEAHLAFLPSTPEEILNPFLARHSIRLSRNKMKKHQNAVLMGTYRRSSTQMPVGEFLAGMEALIQEADRLGIALAEKPVTEFALFDTNDSHDRVWIA